MQFRKVERQTPEGWVEIQFKDLKQGDCFKLYDNPELGSVVEDGSCIYVAGGDVFPAEPEGNYGIMLEERPVEPSTSA